MHGLFSSPKTWHPIGRLLAGDPEMCFVTQEGFGYATPKFRLRLDRRIPDYDDIADQLKTFLADRTKGWDRLVLVAHSQGGLVIQRYLARMLREGKGEQLARIRKVVMYACPNDGSQFALLPRTFLFMGRNPQEVALRPYTADVRAAQKTVLTQAVHARAVGPSTCPISFSVYGGTEDGVVRRESAQGMFPEVAMLPGDHFGIIRPTSRQSDVYLNLRGHLLECLPEGEYDQHSSGSSPSVTPFEESLRVPPSEPAAGPSPARRPRGRLALAITVTAAVVGGLAYWGSEALDDGGREDSGTHGPSAAPSGTGATPSATDDDKIADVSPSPFLSPSPSPSALRTPSTFAAEIRYTYDLGGGCTTATSDCRRAFLYNSPWNNGASTADGSLGEGASITVTCVVTDGRRLGNDVGPNYGGPNPPPYRTWLKLDDGRWATAVYAGLLDGAELTDLPACA
ncbi:esterase/lipase family protein [Streptomyces sp. NPDC020898]|uniref:esterase/lipase family protein n=1 Tax=Streptomyces sp. NPDC020898 TaxID=3365101 RepID=UPI0037BC520E